MDQIWVVVSLHRGGIEGYSAFWKREDAIANAKELITDDEMDEDFSDDYYRCTKGCFYEVYINCVTVQ